MRVHVQWDTDGQTVNLPSVVEIPPGVEDIAGWLSDEYGWLVLGFDFEDDIPTEEYVFPLTDDRSFEATLDNQIRKTFL
jgi:hypothetical protein